MLDVVKSLLDALEPVSGRPGLIGCPSDHPAYTNAQNIVAQNEDSPPAEPPMAPVTEPPEFHATDSPSPEPTLETGAESGETPAPESGPEDDGA